MKNLIIILCALEYAFCRNIETGFTTSDLQDLEKLNKYIKLFKDSGKSDYYTEPLEAIEPEDVTLLVHTKAEPNGVEIQLTGANSIADVTPFNTKLKTVFYVHGWLDSSTGEGSRMLKSALFESTDVNYISINWSKCASSIDYFASQRCVPEVGKYVGEFLLTVAQVYGYSLSDITVVGHSLGAHVGGHIGKFTNGTLGIIIGLDPAAPFYSKDAPSARLTEGDAQYVQGIHTDAIFLGVNYNVGDSDFWPNGGFVQSGCKLVDVDCSHLKAYKYYAESLIRNAFFSRNCDSYSHFKNGTCSQNPKALMGGLNETPSLYGTFYLDTNSESPYGMGDVV